MLIFHGNNFLSSTKLMERIVIMKLCVFPNDPIVSYFEKGEIKDRYYNPENLFNEVHIISFIDKDIKESEVQVLAGNAKLKIHSVGKINLKNKKSKIKVIFSLVKNINPDVIRAYNPLIQGWCAAKCCKELKIPFFLSLHTQYDHNRKLLKKTNWKKFLALKYTEKFIEPFVLKSADKITMVFKIIEPYVKKHVNKKPELLHNKVDFERFANASPLTSLPKPLIISVGRLIPEKNHQCIIKAMEKINAHCLIIGNGSQYPELSNMIKNTKTKKITIKKYVPNSEIPNYYKSAQIFVLAYDPELEGLPIPVMEAMSVGLPIVIPYPKEGYSEGLEDVVVFSKRDSVSFAENINKLLDSPELRKKYSQISQNKAKKFDSVIIEKKEVDIYRELMEKDRE